MSSEKRSVGHINSYRNKGENTGISKMNSTEPYSTNSYFFKNTLNTINKFGEGKSHFSSRILTTSNFNKTERTNRNIIYGDTSKHKFQLPCVGKKEIIVSSIREKFLDAQKQYFSSNNTMNNFKTSANPTQHNTVLNTEEKKPIIRDAKYHSAVNKNPIIINKTNNMNMKDTTNIPKSHIDVDKLFLKKKLKGKLVKIMSNAIIMDNQEAELFVIYNSKFHNRKQTLTTQFNPSIQEKIKKSGKQKK
jgi:hypothetical protein